MLPCCQGLEITKLEAPYLGLAYEKEKRFSSKEQLL